MRRIHLTFSFLFHKKLSSKSSLHGIAQIIKNQPAAHRARWKVGQAALTKESFFDEKFHLQKKKKKKLSCFCKVNMSLQNASFFFPEKRASEEQWAGMGWVSLSLSSVSSEEKLERKYFLHWFMMHAIEYWKERILWHKGPKLELQFSFPFLSGWLLMHSLYGKNGEHYWQIGMSAFRHTHP